MYKILLKCIEPKMMKTRKENVTLRGVVPNNKCLIQQVQGFLSRIVRLTPRKVMNQNLKILRIGGTNIIKWWKMMQYMRWIIKMETRKILSRFWSVILTGWNQASIWMIPSFFSFWNFFRITCWPMSKYRRSIYSIPFLCKWSLKINRMAPRWDTGGRWVMETTAINQATLFKNMILTSIKWKDGPEVLIYLTAKFNIFLYQFVKMSIGV